jgi:tripartite ATP-independent transporter DctM subunit
VLVVLSDQIGVSVGDLFLGALIPGLLLSASYGLYVMFIALVRPDAAPALPPEARTLRGFALFRRALRAIVPPVLLIFAVLGSIFFGIATPTEAGAVGAVGACILAAANRRLNWQITHSSATTTARITGLVIMILICSTFFSVVFDGLGGTNFFKELLVNLPGGYWGFIIFANIAIFLLGIFLEFIEICFIAMPLFVPAAQALGIDMVWFGVMMAINLQMAFISPPVGFSLFYLQSVVPREVTTGDIHNSAWPFMGLQLAVLALVAIFPQTVRWLITIAA